MPKQHACPDCGGQGQRPNGAPCRLCDGTGFYISMPHAPPSAGAVMLDELIGLHHRLVVEVEQLPADERAQLVAQLRRSLELLAAHQEVGDV